MESHNTSGFRGTTPGGAGATSPSGHPANSAAPVGTAASEVLVEVRRGKVIESVHRGSVAVVDLSGAVVAYAGDPNLYTYLRSSAKPIQALSIIETGAFDALGLSERQLAIMCASHSSEPYHVENVLGILAQLGLDESYLQCGAHLPYHKPSAQAIISEGRAPTAVNCNCSGKHSGMLAVAKHMGWDLADYWRADHPVQKLCLENVASVSGYPVEKIDVAIDGCGVSVFALPLRNMALAFARLANPHDPRTGFSPERARAASTIGQAMRAYPEMVAGTGRLCTTLMRVTPVVAKSGAEAVYCFGVPGQGLGMALKIDDGNSRASNPAAVHVAEELGLVGPEAATALEPFAHPVGKNHRGDVTGSTEAVFHLRRGEAERRLVDPE